MASAGRQQLQRHEVTLAGMNDNSFVRGCVRIASKERQNLWFEGKQWVRL